MMSFLVESKALSICYLYLLLDQVDTSGFLGDTMLNLYPGIHFDKVEIPFCIY